MKPGDLVQVRRGVQGQGNVGIVIGPAETGDSSFPLLVVMFHDGPHDCHPSNLQKPDGRTKRRG
jgi:hypothetical protein